MGDMETTTTKKTRATKLNVSSLARAAEGRIEFPNAIEATDRSHLRRCIDAGLLVVVSRQWLRLTDDGIDAVNELAARRPDIRSIEVCS